MRESGGRFNSRAEGSTNRTGRNDPEHGGARLKVAFWLLVFIAILYTSIKIIPVYFANYQLQDRMDTEARYSLVNRRTNDELRDVIYQVIRDHEIPARADQIKIIENDSHGVTIAVEYSVTVDLIVYKLTLNFRPNSDSRSLI